MLKCPARVIGQAAPFALLIAEPSEARVCAAGQSMIGDLVDPLCDAALRRQIGASRPREHRHRGQREWKSAHSLSPAPPQTAIDGLHVATMTANWGTAKIDLLHQEKADQSVRRGRLDLTEQTATSTALRAPLPHQTARFSSIARLTTQLDAALFHGWCGREPTVLGHAHNVPAATRCC